jgi:DNA repair photolyase
VSDPCLPETIELTWKCIEFALSQGVPVQVLTKRADRLEHLAVSDALTKYRENLKVGFSLTGRDDLEPGASSNAERIEAMRILHDRLGITTWASIEPIISPARSLEMIRESQNFCDYYKIGILSGKKDYTPQYIRQFVQDVNSLGNSLNLN